MQHADARGRTALLRGRYDRLRKLEASFSAAKAVFPTAFVIAGFPSVVNMYTSNPGPFQPPQFNSNQQRDIMRQIPDNSNLTTGPGP